VNRPIDAELLAQLLDEQGPALALFAAHWTDAPDDCVQEALVELARQPAVPENVRAWRDTFDQYDALAVAEALEKLESNDREIVVTRIWGGLMYEEIAAALSLSVSSVHRHYFQALQQLRQILESPCSTKESRRSVS
jgi:RNA polymerase sigma-70 factor (ECF subfamily)